MLYNLKDNLKVIDVKLNYKNHLKLIENHFIII